MENFMIGLYNYVTTFQPLVYMLVAIVLIVIGVMFIIPSEQLKKAATVAIPYVVIGCGIVVLATNLATEISSKFVFDMAKAAKPGASFGITAITNIMMTM